MRLRVALLALGALLLTGCGGDEPTPEEVVRAWSDAINDGDDRRAADLFADRARVIQGGVSVRLPDAETAYRFNASLPCSGEIVEAKVEGNRVTATFELGRRSGHTCDAPGSLARAVFQVDGGEITLWHQLPGEPTGTSPIA